ncbi:DEAD/H (Asp-Glu-Ala-Asp/His) box polypeptide 32a isoform X1 [Denticeps clupeoides]|uniref:DEAD/H (Asp-Glu-Ala-Asp/His) box polypeptide 32a isoform X1 n=1 Tax=Denticeps clupeoides TaxID=299321 RepID=UPI0010A45F83|nr:putative pre-mRNA-splicing factor ATP-dependent RNA helicase DHX32 isoform X1 [Denticeps clupeoides]
MSENEGMSDGQRAVGELASGEVFAFGDDLEINQFDGLPYSSRYYKLLKERKTLPVWQSRSQFLHLLRSNQLVIVSGTTKTGKSSQIPQWCAEFCLSAQFRHGTVVCTQIHQQQAINLALRVADEMDVNIGHEVGYRIPLESCCSGETALRYCTDDVLLREMMSDPLLEHYGAVVLDQAHERTVSTDLLLALLKEVLRQRPELRVVVLSIPQAAERLLGHYVATIPLLTLDWPVTAKVVHSSSCHSDRFYPALRLVLEIHWTKEEGDIAVFLASAQEVDSAFEILCKESSKLSLGLGELVPMPLCPGRPVVYSNITGEHLNSRRVFLSHSQAEDMFWAVDSVNFIIDTGMEKKSVYNPRIRANSEVLRTISRCQADLRKQLTGPTGKCFCLYPEETPLPAESTPLLLESNITSTILFLKRMEIAGLTHCDFINRPDPESLMQALEELDYLAALDDDGNLSEIGIIMSEFPLDPQMAKALLASCEFDCVSEVVTIAAMVAAPSCFLQPAVGMETEARQCHMKFQHPEGDHFTLINIYNGFKQSRRHPCLSSKKWCQDYFLCYSALQTADAIRLELLDILRRIELPISEPMFGTKANTLNIKRALLAGFFMQIARDVDDSGNYFMLTNKHIAQVDPLSCYGSKAHKMGLPEWVIFYEHSLSENCIRIICPITPETFIQMAPQYFFYNLPPSESKEILQHMLGHTGSASSKENINMLTVHTQADPSEPQSNDRCVLQ